MLSTKIKRVVVLLNLALFQVSARQCFFPGAIKKFSLILKFKTVSFAILRSINIPDTWRPNCKQSPGARETTGTLSKPRRQRQRRRGKTKGLMSRTMALHVHYKTLYISQPSSAKQQREITTFCVFKTTRVPTANFSCFHWKMKPAFTYSA